MDVPDTEAPVVVVDMSVLFIGIAMLDDRLAGVETDIDGAVVSTPAEWLMVGIDALPEWVSEDGSIWAVISWFIPGKSVICMASGVSVGMPVWATA